MAKIQDFIKLGAVVTRPNIAAPIVLNNGVRGGLHTYSSKTEMELILGYDADGNANSYIQQLLLEEGMIAYDQSGDTYYKLVTASTTESKSGYKWTELTFGGGGEEPKFAIEATYFCCKSPDVVNIPSEDTEVYQGVTKTKDMEHKYDCSVFSTDGEVTSADTCYIYFAIPVNADEYEILINGNLTNAYTKTGDVIVNDKTINIYRLDNKLGGSKVTLLVKQ